MVAYLAKIKEIQEFTSLLSDHVSAILVVQDMQLKDIILQAYIVKILVAY